MWEIHNEKIQVVIDRLRKTNKQQFSFGKFDAPYRDNLHSGLWLHYVSSFVED